MVKFSNKVMMLSDSKLPRRILKFTSRRGGSRSRGGGEGRSRRFKSPKKEPQVHLKERWMEEWRRRRDIRKI